MKIKTIVFNPFRENTYLVYDDSGEAAIIDAGNLSLNENKTLLSVITSNNLTLKRSVNTHLHLDHQFGNGFVSETFHVLPEAHKADEFFIDKLPETMQMYGFPFLVKAQRLGNYLDESDSVTFGNTELRIIHVPGHSPGSLCFYHEKEGVLFSGDVLFELSIGRTDLEQGDHATLINGIRKKLFALPDYTVVYPGHGETTTIGYEKENNPYL
ncbi:MAG: MBL fold metallo-hydrolase [Prevotellaceae bacterium]|nr:MBL fold metallo-hydrolase [Prevotellaceae bacterium]